jgi:phage/plasmid-associated DNA primase
MNKEMANVDEFCDKYDINSMGLDVIFTNKGKEVGVSNRYDNTKAHSDWLKRYNPQLFGDRCGNLDEQIKLLKKHRKHFKFRGMDTQKIYHIDVDIKDDEIDMIPDEWWDFINEWKAKTSYYKSTSKKEGLHLLFTIDDFNTGKDINEKVKSTFKLKDGKSDIEVLLGMWGWIPADTHIIDNGIANITLDEFHTFCNPDVYKKIEKKTIRLNKGKRLNKMRTHVDKKDFNNEQKLNAELGEIIDIEDLDNYDSWCRIVWSLANDINDNYHIAKSVSQRSEKYEENAFNRLWNASKTGNTIGTFYHYAKKGNYTKYNEIRAKYFTNFEELMDDDSLARFYIDSNLEDHCFDIDEEVGGRRTLYTYYKGDWRPETDKRDLLKVLLPSHISHFAVELKKRISLEICKIGLSDGEFEKTQLEMWCKREKNVNKLIAKLNSSSKINSVSLRAENYIVAENRRVEFDWRPELIAFKNICFDLTTLKEYHPVREDYIRQNTGYNYVEPSQEDIKLTEKLINQILPQREIEETYLHFLAVGLSGYAIEKFLIANGGGRNGKGVINELFESLLGQDYFYTAPSEVLLREKKSGGNPELASLHNKRMAIFREPDTETSKSQKINSALLKELTGGNKIACRMNYSNRMICNLKCVLIMECNDKPLLSGSSSQVSMGDRIFDVPFVNTFTDKKHLLDLDGFYPQDPYYKTLAFRERCKIPLFHILLKYMAEYREKTGKYVWEKVPRYDVIEKRTKDYLESSDEIKCWLKEILTTVPQKDKTEMYSDGDFITSKDIYAAFKMSDNFANMSKDERRKYNETYFRNYISTVSPYRKLYEDRYKNKRSILFGFNIKYGDDSDNDI